MSLLKAASVGQQLGISARKVYELHAAGDLPGHRFGRAVRFAQSDVDAYLLQCRSTATRNQAAGCSTSTAASKVNAFAGASFSRPARTAMPTCTTKRWPRRSTPSAAKRRGEMAVNHPICQKAERPSMGAFFIVEARAGVEPTYTDLQSLCAHGARVAAQRGKLRAGRIWRLKRAVLADMFPIETRITI